jgi:hypothetical protein
MGLGHPPSFTPRVHNTIQAFIILQFAMTVQSVRLGKDYDSLDVVVTATPHTRDPASFKCSMPGEFSHRHLRHVTGLRAQRAAASFPPDTSATSSTRVEAADGAGGAAARSPTLTPQGGKVHVMVRASGVVNNDLVTQGPRFPNLYVSVKGSDLHAPLIERIVELPMDITAGRANGEFMIKAHDKASWAYPEFHGRVAVR